MAAYGASKVIPPDEIVAAEIRQKLASYAQDLVTERVLREAVGEQVEAIVSGIALPSLDELTASVTDWIEDHEDEAWSDGVSELVRDIVRDVPR